MGSSVVRSSRRALAHLKLWCGGALALGLVTSAVAAEPILIGQTADFSSVAGQQMKDFNAGALAYFDQVNGAGGVKGRPIKLVSLDDGFNAAKAKDNAKQLVGNAALVALFGSRGTDPSEAVLAVARSAQVPLVAPITGADSVQHDPVAFPVRADYKAEIDAMLSHMNYVPTKLAVLVQDDNFGVPLQAYIESSLRSRHPQSKLVLSVRFQRKQTDLSKEASQILASEATAVIALCNPTSCAEFLKAMDSVVIGRPRPTIYQTSIVDMFAQFDKLGPKMVAGSPFTQVMPDPHRGVSPLLKDYRKAMDKRQLKYTYRSFEGFLSAAVLVEGLRNAASLTPAGLITSFETSFAKGVSFGAMTVRYAPKNHQGGTFVDLVTINKDGAIVH